MDSPEPNLDAFSLLNSSSDDPILSVESSFQFANEPGFENPPTDFQAVSVPSDCADAAAASENVEAVDTVETGSEFDRCNVSAVHGNDSSQYEASIYPDEHHAAMVQTAVVASDWNEMIAASFHSLETLQLGCCYPGNRVCLQIYLEHLQMDRNLNVLGSQRVMRCTIQLHLQFQLS